MTEASDHEACRAAIDALEEELGRLRLPMGPMILAVLTDAGVESPTIEQWERAATLYRDRRGAGGSWLDLVKAVADELGTAPRPRGGKAPRRKRSERREASTPDREGDQIMASRPEARASSDAQRAEELDEQ